MRNVPIPQVSVKSSTEMVAAIQRSFNRDHATKVSDYLTSRYIILSLIMCILKIFKDKVN